MKILRIEFLIRQGAFGESKELEYTLGVVKEAIYSIHWPQNTTYFTLYPEVNGNGVVPIKESCMGYLRDKGWKLEERMQIASRIRPGKVDAIKKLTNGSYFAVEWETGNVASSHRALNKMCIGLMDGTLCGGILIVPSREMYRYLTDRVGNYAEIEPYFPVWRDVSIKNGVLIVIEVEHDALSDDIPKISKGTDGRALR